MPNYFIVRQLVRVGRGENSMLVPMTVKTVGQAPNESGVSDADGNVPGFISIPPVIRVYIGADTWGSPDVMPTHEEMSAMTERPVVHTITLNPRNGNFNWHAGLGKGERTDVCPRTGLKKEETLKPVSGTVMTMPHKLAAQIGLPLAVAVVSLMQAEMESLLAKQEAARKKREEKEAKNPKPVVRKPRKKKPTQAEKEAAEQEARVLAWAAERKARMAG